MFDSVRSSHTHSLFVALTILLGLSALAASRPASAALVVRVQPANVIAGSTGNTFDVVLQNNGPGSMAVDGFSIGLEVASGIQLTGASTDTLTSYIFDGHSLFGPAIATQTGTTLTASDFHADLLGSRTLAAGEIVGLARVTFDVSPAAAGLYTVSLLSFPDTSLSFQGEDVPIANLEGADFFVTAVPEPSGLVLASLGLAACFGLRRHVPARGPQGTAGRRHSARLPMRRGRQAA